MVALQQEQALPVLLLVPPGPLLWSGAWLLGALVSRLLVWKHGCGPCMPALAFCVHHQLYL